MTRVRFYKNGIGFYKTNLFEICYNVCGVEKVERKQS